MDDKRRLRRLRRRLLAWYERNRRDLPWRRTRSAYRVWLAETMLQQTRVETVVPYYRRFLRRFPSMASLARAPLDDVLEVWAGLGYYARARNLHAAARIVVERHRGRLPRDPDAMTALPGVGRYTAGAVLSIAHGLPVPVVDGNVERVLCRLFGLRGDPKRAPLRAELWHLAGTLLPHDRPGDFNQAMMELGATVCTPAGPACSRCPIGELCEARRRGAQDRLPTPPKRKQTPHYDVAVGLIRRRGKLLITKRPRDAMLGGLWEFPGGKREPGETLEEALRREVREETGLEVSVGALVVSVRHAYSHFRVTLHAFECRSPRGRVRRGDRDAHRWVDPAELARYPFPAGTLRILRHLERTGKKGLPSETPSL